MFVQTVESLQKRVADGELNPVFLQLSDEQHDEAAVEDEQQDDAEAEAEAAAEAEADAADAAEDAAEDASEADVDDEGAAVSDAEAEQELQATAEAIVANDDEADEADAETDLQEIDDEAATDFALFVGPPSSDGPILPSATLTSDIIEDHTARLKVGVSDALYYGWEGAVFEVIGFNGLMSDAHVRRNYERLAKAYDLL